MSTTTVNPTSTWYASTGAIAGGAASREAALSDASDSTGVVGSGGAANIDFGVLFGPAGLPDGAAIQSLVATLRYDMNTAGSGSPGGTYMTCYLQATSWSAGTTAASGDPVLNSGAIGLPATRGAPGTAAVIASTTAPQAGAYNPPDGSTQTAARVADRIRLSLTSATQLSAPPYPGLYKASVAVNYVQAPTAASLAVDPGQLSSTTRPQHTYSYASPDSVPLYELQAATWLVSDLAAYPGGQSAFEADPEAAFRDAAGVGAPSFGSKAAKAWTSNPDTGQPGWSRPSQSTSWTPDQSLPFTGDMRTFLRVGATYAGNRLSRKNAAGVSKVSFTMNVVPPAAPTAVTGYWQGAPDYRNSVAVILPADSGPRRLYVERTTNGVNWYPIARGYTTPATPGGAAQTATFYDAAFSPGRPTTYRARTAHPTLEVYGAWVTSQPVAGSALPVLLLRDPLDEANQPVVLRWQGDMESTADEVLGEYRGLGAALPTFSSDAITGSRWQAELIVSDEAAYLALRALRAKRVTMALQSDMEGYWWWVRFGQGWQETLLRSNARRRARTRARRVKVELVETFPIPGQPSPSEYATGAA